MVELLDKKSAIQYLQIDEKVFENYFKNAEEFSAEERPSGRGKFYFDKEKLFDWKENHIARTIMLDKNDYDVCLDFALAMHFKGYVKSDFGTGRQREFGQKITNWVKGQLGEVAFKKFLKTNFCIDIELDFDIYNEIVPQDVVGITRDGVTRVPKLGIGIKSSKPKNIALILGANEVESEDRSSDVYVFCRPALPDDHILRLAKDEIIKSVSNKNHFHTYSDLFPDYEDISCEIAGFCYKDELRRVTSIPGQDFDNGPRYVLFSGQLRRSNEDWKELIDQL